MDLANKARTGRRIALKSLADSKVNENLRGKNLLYLHLGLCRRDDGSWEFAEAGRQTSREAISPI